MGVEKVLWECDYHLQPRQCHKDDKFINPVMEKTSYGLGWTTMDNMTPEIDSFPYAIEINKGKTKGQEVYLILNGCSRSTLTFQPHLHLHFILNNNEMYKHDRY